MLVEGRRWIERPLGASKRSPDPQLLEHGELTPVHQCSSRRLRGDRPEFRTLPTAPATHEAQGSCSEALKELVCLIVKEELRKLLQPQVMSAMSSLATVIRDEVPHAILQPEPEMEPV
ncbi:hypothetical protein HPB52_025552 [Rhipicephalus sanguineus]|uniref:Uncharacterized protein n=1 Tax=Rhipicephalus sanguineus TaxID=34632 RepID=A0A9D4PAE5_RHISA|nr:hypothetical protein HPB52_025552 [Rhipicephalus sanguineus]